MPVFMEGSAEVIVAENVQLVDPVGIRDGWRDCAQRCGLVESLVGPMRVEVDLELPQDVYEVAGVPDQLLSRPFGVARWWQEIGVGSAGRGAGPGPVVR
jgi:hypothetical protein